MPVIDISAEELREKIKADRNKLEIIDVRDADEFKVVSFKGSKNIPLGNLKGRFHEINWIKDVIFVYRSGARSWTAAEMTQKEKGVSSLLGGIVGYYKLGDKDDLEVDENDFGKFI